MGAAQFMRGLESGSGRSQIADIKSGDIRSDFRALLGTAAAMVAFAANSIFCRLALGSAVIDAASFTFLRLVSGTAMLGLICLLQGKAGRRLLRPDILSVLALFGYAAAFSFAYRDLTAGTGALLLFGAVQVVMIGTDRKSVV